MPPRRDLLLALALLLLGETALIEGPHRLGVGVLTVVWSLPLAWRRVYPLPVISLVMAGIALTGLLWEEPSQVAIPLVLIVASYTAGRELDRPAGWLAALLIVGSIWLGLAYQRAPLTEFVFSALMLGAVWALGQALRHRDDVVRETREREREAVREERTRIARELHDVVSHALSVIAIQTQAVRRRLGTEQTAEAADLQAVERVTREALGEMRRLFGVLRANGEPGSLTPQPGLDQLGALIDQAGVPVDLTIHGARAPLPPGVDLAAYRIVQEALTNARRHASPQRVAVDLVYGDPDLEITITDDGGGTNGAPSAGHGLVGMRERVALYGGVLEVSARPEGGFRVAARLPYRT